MPRKRLFWPLVVLSLLLAVPALAEDYSYVRIVRLSLVEGDVQLQRPDVEGWVPAAVNTPLQQGYRIYAGNGRTEIEFESGAVARLAPDTLIELPELILLSSGGRSTQVYLHRGTGTFYANLKREDAFLVITPTLQVSVPEQARFRVTVGEQATTVNVYKGTVGVDSRAGRTTVTKGQMFQVLAEDTSRYYLARNPERDDWDRWNDERDDVVTSARSYDYIPAEVRYGSSDLDRYGNWFYVSNYGYCWSPYVDFGWRPYTHGKWVWYPGLGYTWVSYEQWGWLPYHYGHWSLVDPYGWVWIPGGFTRFSPGRVGWIEGPGWIGWYPLGPGENPRGHSRNRERGTVVTTPIGFSTGRPPDKGFMPPDPEREGRPVDRPSIPPNVQAKMPLVPDEDSDFERPRRGRGPRGEEGEVGGTTGRGTVVTVAPRPAPSAPAPRAVAPPSREPGTPPRGEVRPPVRPPKPGRGQEFEGESSAPERGGIFFDPQEGRYINVPPPRQAPEPSEPAAVPVPPRSSSSRPAPSAPPRSADPAEAGPRGGVGPPAVRERRGPRTEPPPFQTGPRFEGMEPRGGGMSNSPPRERVNPPPARFESRPSRESAPPRMTQPPKPSPPPRESAPKSKRGE